jgi:hypothetical protein
MKPRLSKSAIQLREQIDDCFADRDRSSDGWIGDSKHSARKSDHNPDDLGWVRAIDIDANLDKSKSTSVYLADQIRQYAKSSGRITYVIHMGKICSRKSFWRWVKYTGINAHTHHIHVSFAKTADQDSSFFNIPMVGGTNG